MTVQTLDDVGELAQQLREDEANEAKDPMAFAEAENREDDQQDQIDDAKCEPACSRHGFPFVWSYPGSVRRAKCAI